MSNFTRLEDLERRLENVEIWRDKWARYRDWAALGLTPEEQEFAQHAFQDIRYLLNKLKQLEAEKALLLLELRRAMGPKLWSPAELGESDQDRYGAGFLP